MSYLLPTPKPKLTFMSLFSGVGGFDLGFERAGMKCVGMCEINPQARQVLSHHWSYVNKREDVRNVGRYTFEPVDLICGGFPCQDVSVAGRRAGLDGERSGLWFEFHRIIDAVKPKWAVIENVPGLLSSNEGRDFETILTGLVGSGYRVCWRILDSQYFGVAQRRRRVFIVASLGTGDSAQVLFESESGTGDTQPGGTTGQSAPTYVIKGAAINRQPNAGPQYGEISEDQSYTLNSTEIHAVAIDLQQVTSGINRSTPQSRIVTFNSEQTPKTSRSVRLTLRGEYQAARVNVAIPEAIPMAFMGGQGAKAGSIAASENTFPTLKGVGSGTNQIPDITDGYTVRRLTPVECERLQGFPDQWTNVNGMSDSARYRMMGNAVTVNVAEWIGRRIMEVSP